MSNVPSSSSKTGAANVAEAGREEGPATDMASKVPGKLHAADLALCRPCPKELHDSFAPLQCAAIPRASAVSLSRHVLYFSARQQL